MAKKSKAPAVVVKPSAWRRVLNALRAGLNWLQETRLWQKIDRWRIDPPEYRGIDLVGYVLAAILVLGIIFTGSIKLIRERDEFQAAYSCGLKLIAPTEQAEACNKTLADNTDMLNQCSANLTVLTETLRKWEDSETKPEKPAPRSRKPAEKKSEGYSGPYPW